MLVGQGLTIGKSLLENLVLLTIEIVADVARLQVVDPRVNGVCGVVQLLRSKTRSERLPAFT